MSSLLELEQVASGYGEALALRDVSLRMAEGESVALLGRNGMGKTTLILTIMGHARQYGGRIGFAGSTLDGLPPEARAKLGLGWVPQERNIFRSLTVEENLTAVARPGSWNLERIYAMFPRLAERRRNYGNQLSGGEQQMLAIGRALMTNPRLLLLDEPFEGLAPVIVDELMRALEGLSRDSGLSMLIVEQKPNKVLRITSRAVILDQGRVVHEAPSAQLLNDPDALAIHLGVAGANAG